MNRKEYILNSLSEKENYGLFDNLNLVEFPVTQLVKINKYLGEITIIKKKDSSLSKKNQLLYTKIQLYERWFKTYEIFSDKIWEHKNFSNLLPLMLKITEYYILYLNDYITPIDKKIFLEIKNITDDEVQKYHI